MPGARLLLAFHSVVDAFAGRRVRTLVGIVFVGAALSACSNTSVRSLLSGTGSASGSGISSSPSSSSQGFSIQRVLRSQIDPSGSFDFIANSSGNSSGAFLNYCNPDELPAEEADLCQCVYSYVDSSGNSFTVGEQPTLYESDLIRCPYTSIPSDVTQVQARLYFSPADLYSNAFVYNFGSDAPSESLSDINNYVKPFRFQCQNAVYISHVGEPNTAGGGATVSAVYDPIQSEDPSLAFGFNFYTANPGAAAALFASQPAASQKLWNCPLDLTSVSPLGLDLTLFSRRSDGQSVQIYPPTGSLADRSTFYLAKKKTGVFSVPINAPLMPGVANAIPDVNGGVPDGAAPPLGFGAPPIPAAGGENCPGSNVQIPEGYTWAKLWLFRASLPARFAVTSPRVRNTVISCSPGTWEGDPDVTANAPQDTDPPPLFPDCGDKRTASYKGCATVPECSTLDDPEGSPDVVDRILLVPALANNPDAARCVKLGEQADLNALLAAGKTTDLTGLALNGTYAGIESAIGVEIPLGTDVWTSRQPANANACGTANPFDFLNLCTRPDLAAASGESGAASNFPHETGTTGRPLPRIPIDTSADGSGFSSRFDYVFVVTPVSISKAQMEAASADLSDTHPALPYVPYRFNPASACSSNDPSNPPPGDCLARNKLPYYLKSTDISINADDPANNGGARNLTFPVCVLQPE